MTNKKIEIKELLNFLNQKKIEYDFFGNENEQIEGFSTLFSYKEGTMTFISTLYKFADYKKDFIDKQVQLIIIDPSEMRDECFKNTLQISKPTNVFFAILEHFFNDEKNDDIPISDIRLGTEQKSYISKNAKIGKNVKTGVGCVIEPNVEIGDNTVLHHNVIIRSGTTIGNNCVIKSGTIIGESGFNPSTQKDGTKRLLKHFGGVKIKNNVHIGSNCNIHKGSIEDTIIESRVKMNASVHIAHNCIIGKGTVITMPVYICGSVTVGKECHIAAVTIRNQRKIGDRAVLGLGAVVVKDVLADTTVIGNPAKIMEK